MDSKGKKIAILIVLCSLVAVMAAVAAVNFRQLTGDKKEVQTVSEGMVSVNGQTIDEDGKVHGADLSAFMKDEDFFDNAVADSFSAVDDEKDENGNAIRTLTVLASSVERDIRVKVLDDKGEPVTGQEFMIEVADTGVYVDDDKDGIIVASNIKPGEYKVSLNEISGFKVPDFPVNVRVKSIVSYTIIDDISYFVHSESEIDILNEDTEADVDSADEDDSQYKALLDMEGDERDKAVKLGIDVSKWNGEIDWEVVKAEGVDFAIIRCGYRGSSSGWLIEDPYFFKNIEGAKKAGIKVGVYFFTQATTLTEAVEEASMVVSLIGDTKLDYPVFIDTEGAGGNGRADALDAGTRTAVVNAFCQTIQNADFEAGVYASRNWYLNNLKVDELNECKIWLAEYRSTPEYENPYDMWQYTSSGAVAGINGRVDLNVSYLGVE